MPMHASMSSSPAGSRREKKQFLVPPSTVAKKTSGEVQPQMNWWFRFTGPPSPTEDASLDTQELARRGRLGSIILLVMLIAFGTDCMYQIGTGLLATIPLLLFGMMVMMITVVLNRRSWVVATGIMLIVLIDVGSLYPFIIGQHLDQGNIYLFYLLIEAILVAAFLLPPVAIFLVALSNICLEPVRDSSCNG